MSSPFPPPPFQVVAFTSYTPRNATEVPLVQGRTYTVLAIDPRGKWFKTQRDTGKGSGWMPASYTRLVERNDGHQHAPPPPPRKATPPVPTTKAAQAPLAGVPATSTQDLPPLPLLPDGSINVDEVPPAWRQVFRDAGIRKKDLLDPQYASQIFSLLGIPKPAERSTNRPLPPSSPPPNFNGQQVSASATFSSSNPALGHQHADQQRPIASNAPSVPPPTIPPQVSPPNIPLPPTSSYPTSAASPSSPPPSILPPSSPPPAHPPQSIFTPSIPPPRAVPSPPIRSPSPAPEEPFIPPKLERHDTVDGFGRSLSDSMQRPIPGNAIPLPSLAQPTHVPTAVIPSSPPHSNTYSPSTISSPTAPTGAATAAATAASSASNRKKEKDGRHYMTADIFEFGNSDHLWKHRGRDLSIVDVVGEKKSGLFASKSSTKDKFAFLTEELSAIVEEPTTKLKPLRLRLGLLSGLHILLNIVYTKEGDEGANIVRQLIISVQSSVTTSIEEDLRALLHELRNTRKACSILDEARPKNPSNSLESHIPSFLEKFKIFQQQELGVFSRVKLAFAKESTPILKMCSQQVSELFSRVLSTMANELYALSGDTIGSLNDALDIVKRRCDSCNSALDAWNGSLKYFGHGKSPAPDKAYPSNYPLPLPNFMYSESPSSTGRPIQISSTQDFKSVMDMYAEYMTSLEQQIISWKLGLKMIEMLRSIIAETCPQPLALHSSDGIDRGNSNQQSDRNFQIEREQKERHARLMMEQAERERREAIERDLKERETREQASRERAAYERDARERESQERAARERELREREVREREARERELRECEAREREARERELRDREAREREAREREMRERETRERDLREREFHERELRDREARERQVQEREPRERAVNEREARDRLALDQPLSQESESNVVFHCSLCQTIVTRRNAKFCPSCGGTVVERSSSNCGSCAVVLEVGERFCWSCGTPVDAQPLPKPASVSSSSTFSISYSSPNSRLEAPVQPTPQPALLAPSRAAERPRQIIERATNRHSLDESTRFEFLVGVGASALNANAVDVQSQLDEIELMMGENEESSTEGPVFVVPTDTSTKNCDCSIIP